MGDHERPRSSPLHVVGCRNILVGIPDESETSWLWVQFNVERWGMEPRQGSTLTFHVDELAWEANVFLAVHEQPVTSPPCAPDPRPTSNMATYFAIAGRVTIRLAEDPEEARYTKPGSRKGYLADVLVENAQFVGEGKKVIAVARREAKNVVVGGQ